MLTRTSRSATSRLSTLVTAKKVKGPADAGKTEQEVAIEVQMAQVEQSGSAGTAGQGSSDEVQVVEVEVQRA